MISVTIVSSLVSTIFGAYFILTILILFALGLFFFIRNIWNKRSCFFGIQVRDLISSYLPFLIALTVVLVLAFILVIGLVGSTNADSVFHTFFIRCILDNSKVIDRALPYYEFLLFHPPASHIIGAVTQIITTVPIEKLVLLLTATCAVLTVLSLYSLIKTVFKNKWMPAIACGILIFCWFFWHPMSFTFTISLSAFSIISTMSLSVQICKNFQKRIIHNTILLSLFLSFSFYLHPVVFVYNLTWLLALFIINLIIFFSRHLSTSKYLSWSKFKKLFLAFILGLVLVILFSMPFIHTTYTFMTSSTSGLPPDWIIPSERETFQTSIGTPYYEPTGFLVNVFYLSEFATNHGAFLYLGPYSMIFISSTALLILLRRKDKSDVDHNWNSIWTKWVNLSKWGTIFFIQFELILVFLKYLYKIEFSFLGFSKNTWFEYLLDPIRSWEMLYLPLLLLTCVTFYFIFLTPTIMKNTLKIRKINSLKFSRFYKKNIKIPIINIKGIIIIISFSVVISQILLSYQSGIGNYLTWPPKTYDRAYTYIRQYSLLTTDDIRMFEWIDRYTSKEDVFLVSQIDTGQYLTSVTGRKSIFPYGPLGGSRNYRILIFDIESDPCNPNILPLLRAYNISYVYVGSNAFDLTAPTWKEAVQYNAIFNAEGLIQSPLFELVNKIGDSYLFKVTSENFLEFAGPTISVFTNSLIIDDETQIGSWETRFAENEKNDFSESQSIIFTSKFQLLFNFKQPIDLSKMNYFCFSARSSTQNVYRLSIYDIDGNYNCWDYAVNAQPSLIILNFDSYSEKNENIISLQNIVRVEIELSPRNTTKTEGDSNEINFDIGPVILSKELTKINLTELYNANKFSSQWVMNLKDSENYTLLLPNFLTLTDVEPQTISTKTYPASTLFVDAKNVKLCNLSFQLTSDDLRAINSNFISRPLRNIVLQINNATTDITFSQKSNVVLFGGKSLELFLNSSQMCILRAEDILLKNGKFSLGVFIDGNIKGSRDAVIGIYRTLSDAELQKNCITEFHPYEVHRLALYTEEVKDLSSLYLRIDSLDIIGNFTLSIILQSFGKFY